MDGIHFFGEWFDCASTTVEFTSAAALRELCLSATAAVGLTAVGDTFHQFEPQGVTGTVLLAESHLAIHTWPESGFATVDVFVCNFQADNSAKARALFDILRGTFRPARTDERSVRRSGRSAVRTAA